MKNKLEQMVWFWALWEEHKKTNDGKWKDLTNQFKKYPSFSDALKAIENMVLNQAISLLDDPSIDKKMVMEANAKKLYEILKKENYIVYTYDEFKDIPLLKNIENAFFFFVKGREEVLMKPQKCISVVGSRKTPSSYIKWVEDNVPKETTVSGLAFGADLMGHEWAIKNNLNIVVFPGVDIHKAPTDPRKKKVYEYALKNGAIISSIFPGSKSFDKSIFLTRNKWMAQMIDETYSVYFKGQSGTLGHLHEVAKRQKPIMMPKDVFENNISFLKEYKNMSSIIDFIQITEVTNE